MPRQLLAGLFRPMIMTNTSNLFASSFRMARHLRTVTVLFAGEMLAVAVKGRLSGALAVPQTRTSQGQHAN
jgi:hypothetical protein